MYEVVTQWQDAKKEKKKTKKKGKGKGRNNDQVNNNEGNKLREYVLVQIPST